MFLETERLLLRKFQEKDFADFYEYANDAEMSRMMGRDDMSNPESARFTFDWLRTKEERGYELVLKEANQVIGNLTVTLPPLIWMVWQNWRAKPVAPCPFPSPVNISAKA